MKKIILLALLVVLCFSCNKGKNPTIEDDDTFLTAKVDGIDFEVRGLLIADDYKPSTITGTGFTAGYRDNSKDITLSIANLTTTGTYYMFDSDKISDLETTTYVVSMAYTEGNTEWFSIVFQPSKKSTITITKLNDSYIEGTFNFIGVEFDSKDEKNITEGRFRVKRSTID